MKAQETNKPELPEYVYLEISIEKEFPPLNENVICLEADGNSNAYQCSSLQIWHDVINENQITHFFRKTPISTLEGEDKTHYHIADNSDGFRDWLSKMGVEYIRNGHFTSIPLKDNDIFQLGLQFGLYRYLAQGKERIKEAPAVEKPAMNTLLPSTFGIKQMVVDMKDKCIHDDHKAFILWEVIQEIDFAIERALRSQPAKEAPASDAVTEDRYVFIKDYFSEHFENAAPILKGSYLKWIPERWIAYSEDDMPIGVRFTRIDHLIEGGFISPIGEALQEKREDFEASDSNASEPVVSLTASVGNSIEHLLTLLAVYGGKIVSTASLSTEWIEQARASGRMFVDENSLGYVWEPDIKEFPTTVEEMGWLEKWYPLPVEMPEHLKDPSFLHNLQRKNDEPSR